MFLSDKNKKISKLYNANGFLFPSRKTVIIDTSGYMIKIYDKISIETHPEDILDFISDYKKSK